MKMHLRLPLLAACVLTALTFSNSNAYANDPGPHRGALRYEPYHESRRDFNNWLERRYSAEGHRTSPIADDPGNGNGGGQAPIDGGLSLLLAAGLGLGVKKAMKKKAASLEEAKDISAQ